MTGALPLQSRAYTRGLKSAGNNQIRANPYNRYTNPKERDDWEVGYKHGMAIDLGIKEVKSGRRRGSTLDVHV